jgi:hypothetical protein
MDPGSSPTPAPTPLPTPLRYGVRRDARGYCVIPKFSPDKERRDLREFREGDCTIAFIPNPCNSATNPQGVARSRHDSV